MKEKEIYHALITNLEGAINNLDNQIYKDLFDAPLTDIEHLYSARGHCKDLTYHKCQIMENLIKLGLLKYGKEPF